MLTRKNVCMPHKLLNHYEEITYNRLTIVADKCGARVFPKVRIADAVPLDNSGISDKEFSFALKAHFDFLITDADSHPLFVVEFDGPTHLGRQQRQRDGIKDNLAGRFELPLLRINANYLNRKYRSLDLLTYFVDVWFLRQSFLEAQMAGQISWDEPFDPASVISDGSHKQNWPFWLCVDAQAKFRGLFDNKKVAAPGPDCWTGVDDKNQLRCLASIRLPTGEGCFVETGMRSQNFPVAENDVLEQIATVDLYDVLDEILEGRIKPHPAAALDAKTSFYIKNFKSWSSITFS
jgi:hypothetical protein